MEDTKQWGRLYPTKEQRAMRRGFIERMKNTLEAQSEHMELNDAKQVMALQRHLIILDTEMKILEQLDKLERYLELQHER